MYSIVVIALLVTLVLFMVRVLLGPTVYDRILALNAIGTQTLLLIATLGYLTKRPEFLDIALVYALINFVSVIAVTRFVKFHCFGVSDSNSKPGET